MKTISEDATISPIQTLRDEAFNVNRAGHPAHDEIGRVLGSYQLTATIERDEQTLKTMNHVTGLISLICYLRMNGRIVGIGRGSAVLSRANRFLEKTVRTAFNSSLAEAVRSTRALDSLSDPYVAGGAITEPAVTYKEEEGQEKITPRQKNRITEWFSTNISDKHEREQRIAQLDQLSKLDASDLIYSFLS